MNADEIRAGGLGSLFGLIKRPPRAKETPTTFLKFTEAPSRTVSNAKIDFDATLRHKIQFQTTSP